jgi:hypothetical protein
MSKKSPEQRITILDVMVIEGVAGHVKKFIGLKHLWRTCKDMLQSDSRRVLAYMTLKSDASFR